MVLPCGSTLFLFGGWEIIASFLVINKMLMETMKTTKKTVKNCENYGRLLKTVKTVGGVWPLTDIIPSCIIPRNRARY